VPRPSMRFVAVKSESRQATLMLHRVRDQLIGQRTATIPGLGRRALRGHLAELGIVAAQRQAGVRELMTAVAAVEDHRVPPPAREVLQLLVAQIRELADKIAGLDRRLIAMTRTDATCRSLTTVPGIGPVIATAFAATVPEARVFRSGRHLAAWLGLVPGQHRTAGKERRLGISKRGDGYLRRQLIHGGPSPGPDQPRPDGQALRAAPRRPPGVGAGSQARDRGLAHTPAVQRRGRGGRQQAGADHRGDPEPRRGLPCGGLRGPERKPPRSAGGELSTSCEGDRRRDGRIGRTEAGRARAGPRASSSFA